MSAPRPLSTLFPALRQLGVERIVTIDFETFWSQEYTLSKMDSRAYIRDPQFKIHGFSLSTDDGPVAWAETLIEQDMLLRTTDWSTTALLATNASFDGGILSQRFGIRPKLYLDTCQMAAAHIKPFTRRVSLDATHRWLAAMFPDRDPPPFKGNVTMTFRSLREIPPNMMRVIADYCISDNTLSRWCAQQMLPWFTADELLVMHQTTAAYLQPKLCIDTDMLMKHVVSERARKDALLNQLQIDRKQIMSNPQFALLLEANGVVAPTKVSATTGNTTYAFAKTDLAFLALQHHPNPTVSLLVQIRLGTKSTIEETRAQRLLDMVADDNDPLPVPLAYHSAHTGRFGGCLVADTVVTTLAAGVVRDKRIIDVLLTDFVWDGIAFVEHAGVQFSGYAKVVTHDGITGTPDHVVFTDAGEIGLRDAMQAGHTITPARYPTQDDVDSVGIDLAFEQVPPAVLLRLRRGA